MVPMNEVQSSVIARWGYDTSTKVLAVAFKNGKVYHHQDVPHEIVKMLEEADSIGSAYSKLIRGRYVSEQVAGQEGAEQSPA